MQREIYKNSKNISQSQLKKFRFLSPLAWKRIYLDGQKDDTKDSSGFVLGDLVDTICFTPEELEARFYIGTMPEIPSEAVVHIITDYYNKIINYNQEQIGLSNFLPVDVEIIPLTLEDSKMLIESANSYKTKDKDGNEKIGWNTGWKEQTRIDSLVKNGSSYFESLKEAKGRKIISHSMNIEAIELRNILQTHPDTKDYFIQNNNNLLIFQLEIFSRYQSEDEIEVPVKGALDIVRFNHVDKTVQIIDFKTSYSAFDFLQSIKKFGYSWQLSFYTFLLSQWLLEHCEGKYCNYIILPPLNIVIDNKDKTPYLYEYMWQDIDLARTGNKKYLFDLYQTENHNQKIYEGWETILNNIAWHINHNLWEKTKEHYLTGKIRVNLLNS